MILLIKLTQPFLFLFFHATLHSTSSYVVRGHEGLCKWFMLYFATSAVCWSNLCSRCQKLSIVCVRKLIGKTEQGFKCYKNPFMTNYTARSLCLNCTAKTDCHKEASSLKPKVVKLPLCGFTYACEVAAALPLVCLHKLLQCSCFCNSCSIVVCATITA